jgi:2'-5' RNA ligase
MKQRLFVAIKLNQTTFDALRLFQMELKKELPFKGIRWVDPGLFHLTLQFLGDTEINQIPRLISNLESVGQQIKSFDLVLDGVGHFGSKSSI